MDPAGAAGGINPYTFADGEPANRIDPSGMDETDQYCHFWWVSGTKITVGVVVYEEPGYWAGGCSEYEDAGSFAPQGATVPTGIPATGGGPGAPSVVKHLQLTTSCKLTPGQVMGAVEHSFAAFGNYSWGPFDVIFHPPAGLRIGSQIPISVSYFIFTQQMAVQVGSMSPRSMTFRTLPGNHLLYPASITFAASSHGSNSVHFDISLAGSFNGFVNGAKYYIGGALLENAQWRHFLGKISTLCTGGG